MTKLKMSNILDCFKSTKSTQSVVVLICGKPCLPVDKTKTKFQRSIEVEMLNMSWEYA